MTAGHFDKMLGTDGNINALGGGAGTVVQTRGKHMSVGTIILIILVLALLGGFSGIGGSPFYGTGYYGGGGLGLVIVVVLILVLMGRI
jgi:Protein of unknown function (DUF3309)